MERPADHALPARIGSPSGMASRRAVSAKSVNEVGNWPRFGADSVDFTGEIRRKSRLMDRWLDLPSRWERDMGVWE
jgi:hypothetical protein